jgi:transposase InsO family protein
VEVELQAGASDLEGGAHAVAAEAAENSEIAGIERQRVPLPPGDASEPSAELSPLTERTEDGSQLRILVVIDEFTRECVAIEAGRSFTARDVIIITLHYLFAVRAAPEHLRSDNGPEFVAKEIQK